jgi:hypothetical protein
MRNAKPFQKRYSFSEKNSAFGLNAQLLEKRYGF